MAWDTARTKQLLLDAAVEEFAEFGPAGARVAKIAKRAGVNQERIHQYFGNKPRDVVSGSGCDKSGKHPWQPVGTDDCPGGARSIEHRWRSNLRCPVARRVAHRVRSAGRPPDEPHGRGRPRAPGRPHTSGCARDRRRSDASPPPNRTTSASWSTPHHPDVVGVVRRRRRAHSHPSPGLTGIDPATQPTTSMRPKSAACQDCSTPVAHRDRLPVASIVRPRRRVSDPVGSTFAGAYRVVLTKGIAPPKGCTAREVRLAARQPVSGSGQCWTRSTSRIARRRCSMYQTIRRPSA
ncbi:helix-turn-helix domain-containing protein [Streptomyces sp. SID3343]|uniref:TetR/AcrR family transcriptional regulator n=1 Tax=Streptomyces sp. SID3343 TaxID=2690260 RepID=UPI00136B84D5|nr:helix-turn-helix domain-containing protein [Streptomyces sp. SID3343]MYW04883.1 TetR family transcriptional regulator [Streptomyces sp. SID3343]